MRVLAQYTWYNLNSEERAWPCGGLQPNDLGLFDMLGNVSEWCQDVYAPYQVGNGKEPSEDSNVLSQLNEREPRILRGGSFNFLSAFVRTSFRYRVSPSIRSPFYGFRLARTCP